MRYLVTILTLAGLAAAATAQNTATSASSPATAAAAHKAKAAVSASSSGIPAAVQKALAQPEGKERDKAVRDAAVEWQKSDPAAALGWATALPPKSTPNMFVSAVSQAWASRDPAAAVAWSFANFVKKPGSFETLAFHLALCSWAGSDPKAAAAWADAAVPAGSSANTIRWVYGSVGDGWGRVDPVATAAWAETVKNDKNREVALAEAAKRLAFAKPEEAAVWAKRLPPAELKIDVVRPIFETLYHRDAAKATAWLDSLTIPDEMKAELKKKAEPKKPKA